MHDFDVILGTDWLATNYVSIDCFSKEIVFHKPEEKEFRFQGIRNSYDALIYVVKATEMLMKGSEGFLAFVSSDNGIETRLEDILVVKEFSDVFSEDLYDFPPDREIEFVIDVVPGIAHISKAPYRMAPTEHKELKT
ncbi:hypothetical protein LWI28_028807 [Acer negundo]|uniref:Uncharacterized protein n=1 Tax=Acer negundo TaxID=4023 RepID=A0AAD5J7C5_ACENE|nr:hypothetical protein LWI28_028807 [Acer negundo]